MAIEQLSYDAKDSSLINILLFLVDLSVSLCKDVQQSLLSYAYFFNTMMQQLGDVSRSL